MYYYDDVIENRTLQRQFMEKSGEDLHSLYVVIVFSIKLLHVTTLSLDFNNCFQHIVIFTLVTQHCLHNYGYTVF